MKCGISFINPDPPLQQRLSRSEEIEREFAGLVDCLRPVRISEHHAAARYNVPAVYGGLFPCVREGGLLSHGPDLLDLFRRAATYVDRLLRGAKPGDLPVQFPTKFEMVVNLKTAKALGLAVPPSILLRADEQIE